MGNLIHVLVILLYIPFNFNDTGPNSDKAMTEHERINGIDFSFQMTGNQFIFEAEFETSATLECSKHLTFEYDHKKKYTKGPDQFILAEKGENWYKVHFIIQKYLMAEVDALYLYQLDAEKNKVNFEMISTKINIPYLNIVNSSNGNFTFVEKANTTKVIYTLNYHIKNSIFKRTLFNIQKKETINFQSDYKNYLENHCFK